MTCPVCAGTGTISEGGDVVKTCRYCTPQTNPPEVPTTQGRRLPTDPAAVHDAFPNSPLKGPLHFPWPINNSS
jgi:hypothetical protein